MHDYINQNRSFTEMTCNPYHELAIHILSTTLQELEAEGAHHQIHSEVLFNFVMIEMAADSLVTQETSIF